MSYDIDFYQPVGDSLNYTSNCSPMFRLALGGNGLNDLNDREAHEVMDRLKDAITRMEGFPDAFEALAPSNGFGDYAGAVKFLKAILENCMAFPNSTLRISY